MSSPSAFSPQYVDRKQAAAMVSCSVQTISKLIRTRKLPACYLGRAVRIKVTDLLAAMPAYDPAAPLGNLRKKKQQDKRRVN